MIRAAGGRQPRFRSPGGETAHDLAAAAIVHRPADQFAGGVCHRDCSPAAVTGPLSDLNALQLSQPGQIYQLISDLGELLNISPVTPAASLKAIQDLAMLNRPAAA